MEYLIRSCIQDDHVGTFPPFFNWTSLVALDIDHSTPNETRFYCFGKIGNGIVTVRFTTRKGITRIFGAGYWRKGRKEYEKKHWVHRRSDRELQGYSWFPSFAWPVGEAGSKRQGDNQPSQGQCRLLQIDREEEPHSVPEGDSWPAGFIRGLLCAPRNQSVARWYRDGPSLWKACVKTPLRENSCVYFIFSKLSYRVGYQEILSNCKW